MTGPGAQPLLIIDRVARQFRVAGGRTLTAVRDFSLAIQPGEAVGLVGESGSGKSTIGRMAIALLAPTRGRVVFAGDDLARLSARALRTERRRMQIVFQDPWGALNPRHTVARLIEEPLLLHTTMSASQRREEAGVLADRVQLGRALLERYPAQLSGGQLQRVCIARALATRPELLVLDEPTSSLDVSVRAGILSLLDALRRETGIAMLFISHDLDTVRAVCDRVVVLYLGCEVESGPVDAVFDDPAHPYTQALLSAHLSIDPGVRTERQQLVGEIPSPLAAPPGCPFATRCPIAQPACDQALPEFRHARAARPHAGRQASEPAHAAPAVPVVPAPSARRARCLRLPPEFVSVDSQDPS